MNSYSSRFFADLRVDGRPFCALFIALCSHILVYTAYAADVNTALNYESPESIQALERIEFARAEFQRTQLGLSGSLELIPQYKYDVFKDSDTTNEATEPYKLPIGLGLEYRYDRANLLDDHIDLMEAEQRYRATRREDIRDALVAHADLLISQVEADLAALQIREAREELANAELRYSDGELNDLELSRVKLAYESQQVESNRAEQVLRNAVEEAARYGLAGKIEFRPRRFVLKNVEVEAIIDYQQAMLEVAYEEEIVLRNSVYGILDEAIIQAEYEENGYKIVTDLGIVDGKPGVGVEADLVNALGPTEDKSGLTLTFKATLRLDDETLDNFSTEDVEASNNNLNAIKRNFSRELRNARESIDFSERELGINTTVLSLDEQLVDELEEQSTSLPARVEALRKQLRTAAQQLNVLGAERERATSRDQPSYDQRISTLSSTIENFELQLAEAEEASTNIEEDLNNARVSKNSSLVALYRSWQGYVQQVFDFLELTDGVWELSMDPS